MSVVEQFTVAANNIPGGGDDRIVICDTAVAVIDGESNKSGLPESPGSLAADLVAEAVCSLPAELSSRVVADHLTEAVQGVEMVGNQQPAAAVSLLHIPSRTVYQIGDVAVGIDGVFFTVTKQLDRIAGAARAALWQSMLDDGLTPDDIVGDPGRDMILPLLKASWKYRNRDHEYGYGDVDGTLIPLRYVYSYTLPVGPCEVVLASDGYATPMSTLAESEQVLSEQNRLDPLRISEPVGLKRVQPGGSFDDRSYIKFQFS